ncbi:hypothetical protein KAU33_04300 [Candidatus Dependentiae bacterium]|nr:hypothetical protein [Candidatus Dependentiae bacterium]
MENLTREELIESATRQGINLEEVLEALGEGKPIKRFMTTLSTGKEVFIVDNLTDVWDKVKGMYNKSV